MLILGAEGDVERVVDMTRIIRNYSAVGYDPPREEAVNEKNVDSVVERAARWYLKRGQEGPTPDGVIWLCTGIESLVPPTGGRKRRSYNAAAISDALTAAGDDPSRFRPSVGRVGDLRARVIHDGEEEPDQLRPGFYVLEEICRVLIRYHSGLGLSTGWPLAVPSADMPERPRVRKQYLRQFEWIDQVEEVNQEG